MTDAFVDVRILDNFYQTSSFYPMPVVLVGAEVEGKANFMTAAFLGIANYKPPVVAYGNLAVATQGKNIFDSEKVQVY